MSTRLFRLVPPASDARIRGRRASRVMTVAAAAIAGLSAALIGGATWLDGESREQLAKAQKEGAPVIRIEQELAALKKVDEQLAAALTLQRSLATTIPAHSLIRAVSETLPKGAIIRSMSLEYRNVQGSTRKQRRAGNETEAQQARTLVCVVEGIASDDRDVGAFVEGLSGVKPLTRVTLESSRTYEFRGKNAREFKVTFAADLDRRWKLPQITTVTEAGENKP